MDARDLFQNLCLAAMVDGELGESERRYLEAKAKALKLTPDQSADILAGVASKLLVEFKKPTSAAACRKLFEECVAITRADKQLTGQEQEFLRRLGNALEIDEEDMAAAVQPKKKKKG